MSVERGPIEEIGYNLKVGTRITGVVLGHPARRVGRLVDFYLVKKSGAYRFLRYLLDPQGETLWQGDQNRE